MSQTPCIKVSEGAKIYDPSAATRNGGDVALLGMLPLIVLPTDPNLPGKNTFDLEGLYDVPKDTSVFAAGDPVYWNPTGSPVTGTASSGAATSTNTGYLLGFATLAALTGDSYVRTKPTPRQPPTAPVQSLAAAGSSNTDAAAVTITAPIGIVVGTGADGTKGIILPAAPAGTLILVKNIDAANAILKVYPPSGAQINALTATTGGLSMAAKTCAWFAYSAATQIYTAPLLPS